MKFSGPFELLVTGALREFAIQKLPDGLRAVLTNDAPVTEKSVVRMSDFALDRDVKPATDLGGLACSLRLSAQYELDAGFFAPEDLVQLADLEIPWPDQSVAPYAVPADKMLCAIELAAGLAADAGGKGLLHGISIGLAAKGRSEVVLRFFKEFPANTGARTALVGTFRASKSPFTALQHPPQSGETLVAEFSGDLQLAVQVGYGWSLEGSTSFGEEIAGVDLMPTATGTARAGLSGSVRVGGAHNLVVRQGLRDPNWLNVSFVKRRSSEETLAASVSADVDIRTSDAADGGAISAAFIDGLLGRTPLPDLMARIRRLDPVKDPQTIRARIKEETIERLSAALRAGLEPKAIAIDEAYRELADHARALVEAYGSFDADILAFVESMLENSHGLAEFDDAVDAIDRIASASDLEEVLEGGALDGRILSTTAIEKLRQILLWTRTICGDATPLESWLPSRFADLKRLITRYRAQRARLETAIEAGYRKLQGELGVSGTIERVRTSLAKFGPTPLEILLQERIVWLETHLTTRLRTPVDALTTKIAEVEGELKNLVAGYDQAKAKATEALTRALNQHLELEASLSWSRLKVNQTLASVDIDPASAAGQESYRHLLRGDIAAALELRASYPESIRFWKSYLVEEVSRTFTIRTQVNGCGRITVDRLLLSSATRIEATDDGEIVVQSVKAVDEKNSESRRKLVHVQTMLAATFTERFAHADDRLLREDFEVTRWAIGYSYLDRVKKKLDAPQLRKRLSTARKYTGWLLENDAAWEQAQSIVEATMRVQPIDTIDIRVDAGMSDAAFGSIFRPDRDRDQFHAALSVVYDQAFALMPFTGSMPAFVKTWMRGAKDGYIDLLLAIHRDVFIDGRGEQIKPLVTKLGEKMKDLNRAGQLPGRNFVMSMFILLAPPSERAGSLRLGYVHPVTGTPTETRFDRLPA